MAKQLFIEKSIVINKDIHEVFSFLQETKNQDKFSVWNMKDPSMKKTYTGVDGTKGFTYIPGTVRTKTPVPVSSRLLTSWKILLSGITSGLTAR